MIKVLVSLAWGFIIFFCLKTIYKMEKITGLILGILVFTSSVYLLLNGQIMNVIYMEYLVVVTVVTSFSFLLWGIELFLRIKNKKNRG